MSSASFPNVLLHPLRRVGAGRTKLYRVLKPTTFEATAIVQECGTSIAAIPLGLMTSRRARVGLHFRQAALMGLQISVFIGLSAAVLFLFAKGSGF